MAAFPTRVGMTRNCSSAQSGLHGFPHSRGDDPLHPLGQSEPVMLSPLAWG